MTTTHNTQLADRVILITGAGGGIGSAVALAAAQAGAELILCGRTQAHLDATYDAIVAAGGPQPALFPIDFVAASNDDYNRLAEGIRSDCGRLDGIVHLAAHFDALMPFTDQTVDAFRRNLHVNLTAAFAITKACLPLLVESGDASVIFAADSAGAQRKPFWGGYAVAKAGLDCMMTILAQELEHQPGLRFNAVDPGPTRTKLRKLAFPRDDPDASTPQAVVPTFMYLLGPDSHDINGQTLHPGSS